LTEFTGITSADHGDAILVQAITIHQDTDTNDGINIGKVSCDGVLRCIEERNSQCAYQHGHIKIRDPSAFIREPDFALDPHGSRRLLGHADLRRDRDGVIVSHRGHLAALLLRLDVRDLVRARITRRTGGLLRELRQGFGREGGEEVGHGVPGTLNEGGMDVVCAVDAAGGELVVTGHGGKKLEGTRVVWWRSPGSEVF